MDSKELKSIINKSGMSVNAIEKHIGIGQGVLGKVMSGKRKIPEKYWEPIRNLVKIPDVTIYDIRDEMKKDHSLIPEYFNEKDETYLIADPEIYSLGQKFRNVCQLVSINECKMLDMIVRIYGVRPEENIVTEIEEKEVRRPQKFDLIDKQFD